jgi:type II secretory ATPase GspE/PulE/Tfp pilus assembly ATPase PilB-like protein
VDMGVEPFLISSSLVGVLAQRLVRRLCPKCRVEWPLTPALIERLKAFGVKTVEGPFYHAPGCDDCRGTGYRGRIGVFELLTITPELRELILQRCSSGAINEASQGKVVTMQEDAMRKTRAGVTSVEEVLRVCSGD